MMGRPLKRLFEDPTTLTAFTITFVFGLQIPTTTFFSSVGLFASFFVLLSSGWPKYPRILVFIAATTFVFLFVGNLLFSPGCASQETTTFLFFQLNSCGVENGYIAGARRTAMIFVGFAWLNCISVSEMASVGLRASSLFGRSGHSVDRYILVGFGFLEKLRFNLNILTQVVNIHTDGTHVPFATRIRRKILLSYLRLSGLVQILLRCLESVTYSGETLFPTQGALISSPLEVKNLSVGSLEIEQDKELENFNAVFEPNEIVRLMSDESHQSSLLLKCLGGIIPKLYGQSSGQVLINGKNILEQDYTLRAVVNLVRYVPADPLYSVGTPSVLQQVQATSDTQSHTLFKTLGLVQLMDRPISELSGGERAALGITTAIVADPAVLLIDNALTELDQEKRPHVVSALVQFSRRPGKLVIYATGASDPLSEFCSRRVLVSKKSRPDRSFKKPQNAKRESVSNTLLKMDSIAIELSGKTVVSDFSFEVFQGEIVGLLGPNGCGKTTTMLAAAGAIAVKEGRVEKAGPIGYSFQFPELQFLTRSVDRELGLRGILRNCDQRRVENHFSLALSIDPRDLTKSDQRKLSIDSMIFESCLLVLDEPSKEMDAEEFKLLMVWLREYANAGRGVVIITHDPSQMQQLDRVVRMHP